jgi:protein-S-isoprenylcysteine O-methyltransferase Ste14
MVNGGVAVLKLPPPVWALIYVLAALAISWQLNWPHLLGFPLPKLGLALAFLPWVLPVWAAIRFHREGTEINPISPTNRALIVDGPYRYTRNPMYLGHLIFMAGLALTFRSWLGLVILVVNAVWFDHRVRGDEKHLRALFGAAYDDYCRRAKRWIPGLV